MSEKKDLLETMVSEGIKRIIIIHHNDNDGLVGGGHAHACGWRSCFNPFADLECIPVDEDVARRMKNEH